MLGAPSFFGAPMVFPDGFFLRNPNRSTVSTFRQVSTFQQVSTSQNAPFNARWNLHLYGFQYFPIGITPVNRSPTTSSPGTSIVARVNIKRPKASWITWRPVTRCLGVVEGVQPLRGWGHPRRFWGLCWDWRLKFMCICTCVDIYIYMYVYIYIIIYVCMYIYIYVYIYICIYTFLK